MENKEEKSIVAEERVPYPLLEVYFPSLRSAGQVSAPRREFAVVLRADLQETAHTSCVNSPLPFEKVMHAHAHTDTHTHTHSAFTRVLVLRVEFLHRELRKVVIIKRVPRRL